MKTKITYLSLFLLCCVLPARALHVIATGAHIVANGTDTLLIFDGEPQLKVPVGMGPIDWYRADGTILQTNSEEVYPASGEGIRVIISGRDEIFYVFDYNEYRPHLEALAVTPYCTRTDVELSGIVPPMQYTTPSGLTKTYERTCSISYTTLAWNGEQWTDSLAVADELPLREGTFQLPPFYTATSFALTFEPLAELLDLPLDSIVSEEVAPIAVSAYPTSVTTVRGAQGERSNEVDRPTDASVLKGSAPLEMEFFANPTPAVEYYDWRIYRGSDLIVQRMDPQHRYTFMEPGNYRVVCYVSGTECPCKDEIDPDCAKDSTEISISVSESQLRVPNAFTPNGDGKNDEFRVQYRSLREFHCWVYNRWGKLVYEWTDPAKGWDGTISGRPAAEGAYYYVIRALGTDAPANASYGSKTSYNRKRLSNDEAVIGVYRLSGDINLIRGK